MKPLINLEDLPGDETSHSLIGAEHGNVPISIILVHCRPGDGPELHRHSYPEVFVVEAGQATFSVDGAEIVAQGGQIVTAPAGAAHRFRNTGDGELRMVCIHTAPRFNTEWLTGPKA